MAVRVCSNLLQRLTISNGISSNVNTCLRSLVCKPCAYNGSQVIGRPCNQSVIPTTLEGPVCKHHSTTSNISHTISPKKGSQTFSTSVLRQLNEQEDDTSGKEVIQNVNTALSSEQMGRLFAVVHLGATQRKITQEDIILVHGNFQADCGERIRLEKVLMVGSKDFSLIGRPLLSRDVVRVEATVIEKRLDQGKIIMRFKKRKRHKRMYLHRQPLTYLRINSIDITALDEEVD